MSAIDLISNDLDWREGELASLRILLSRPDHNQTQKRTLLRAAWAMLYAHYEGFVKFSLTVFYDEIRRNAPDCNSLPPSVKALAVTSKIKSMKSMETISFLDAIERFTTDTLSLKPAFPDIDTESNLWPSTLSNLLIQANISLPSIIIHEQKIKTLVARRNEIAHGEQNFIEEVDYYISYEKAVYDIMYDLALTVSNTLEGAPYYFR